MISMKQLQYAQAVGETLHFKKAAEQCCISQSALSTALTELEKHLQLQIFERTTKKVMVTAAGQEVLNRAADILLKMKDIEQLAAHYQAPLGFPLKLGVIPTVAPYLIPTFLPALHAKYPSASLSIVEEQSKSLVEQVQKGTLDAAILAFPFACDGLLRAFVERKLCLVVTPARPFDKQISADRCRCACG